MKIDKLLKGYARHRRESAGSKFELHAATKHLLQGEVARAYRGQNKTAQSGSSGFRSGGVWRRLAWRFGVFACFALVLAAMYPVLFPKNDIKRVSLAKLEKPAQPFRSKPAEQKPPSPAPPRAAAPALEVPVNKPVAEIAENRRSVKLPEIETLGVRVAGDPAQNANEARSLGEEPKAVEEPTLLADRSDRKLSAKPVFRRGGSTLASGRGMLRPQSEQTNTSLAIAAPDTDALAVQSDDRVLAAGSLTSNVGMTAAVAPAIEGKNSLGKSKAAEIAQLDARSATVSNENVALGFADERKSDKLGEASASSLDKDSYYDYTLNFSNQAGLAPGQAVAAQNTEKAALARYSRTPNAAPSSVLNSFRLRQQGNSVTIIDADGSVYKGSILTQDAAVAASTLSGGDAGSNAQRVPAQLQQATANVRQAAGKLQNNGMQQAQNGVLFQATGSNGLHQNVAIQGQIVGLNNAFTTNRFQANVQAAPTAGNLASFFFSLSNNAATPIRIQGQVIFGDTNRLEIDAVQQKP